MILAFEAALRGKQVKYVGPSEKMIRGITLPIVRKLLAHCPESCRPKYVAGDSTYHFPGGGTILLAGANSGGSESLRGVDIDLAILDEEAFMHDPDYLITGVMLSRVLKSRGRFVHISTPPRSPSHQFAARMRRAAEVGTLMVLPVTENTDMTPEELESYERELGGASSTAYRREMLCEVVTESTYAVISETPSMGCAPVLGAVGASAHIDYSGAISVFSFCTREDELVVTDCAVGRGWGSDDLIAWCRARNVTTLVTNADPGSLSRLANAGFSLSKRESTLEQVDALRSRMRSGLLFVSDNARDFSRHLTDAVWNDARTDFEDSGDGSRFGLVKSAALLCVSVPALSGSPNPLGYWSMSGRAFLGA